MQIKQNLLHSLRQAFKNEFSKKNEFSQNEIKLSTSLGNNKVVNERETGSPFFFNLQETLFWLGKVIFS